MNLLEAKIDAKREKELVYAFHVTAPMIGHVIVSIHNSDHIVVMTDTGPARKGDTFLTYNDGYNKQVYINLVFCKRNGVWDLRRDMFESKPLYDHYGMEKLDYRGRPQVSRPCYFAYEVGSLYELSWAQIDKMCGHINWMLGQIITDNMLRPEVVQYEKDAWALMCQEQALRIQKQNLLHQELSLY